MQPAFFRPASGKRLPFESPSLIGQADPISLAAQYTDKGLAGEVGSVVLVRQVGGNQMFQFGTIESGQQGGGLAIAEMAESPAYSCLQPRGIGAAHKQVTVMIRFQYQPLAT